LGSEDESVKSIVELINELKGMDEMKIAERFHPPCSDVARNQKLDFDNWLRRCVPLDRKFANLDEAWSLYGKSFG
jgi:hypothetical protein